MPVVQIQITETELENNKNVLLLSYNKFKVKDKVRWSLDLFMHVDIYVC